MKRFLRAVQVFALALFAAACEENRTQSVVLPVYDFVSSFSGLAVACGDKNSAVLGFMHADGTWRSEQFPIHTVVEIAVFESHPFLYVLNEYGMDNLQRLDLRSGRWSDQLKFPGNNLSDVLPLSTNKVLSVGVESNGIYEMDFETRETRLAHSLADLSDGDGSPEPFKLTRTSSGQVFLVLQRLLFWKSVVPGTLLELNITDGTVERLQTIPLRLKNPSTRLKESEGEGYLVMSEGSSQLPLMDGALDSVIGPRAPTTVTTEKGAEGEIYDFLKIPGSDEWAFITWNPVSQFRFFSETSGIQAPKVSSTGFHLQQIVWWPRKNAILVADRDPLAYGIHVFTRASGGWEKTGFFKTPMPPTSIVVLEPGH